MKWILRRRQGLDTATALQDHVPDGRHPPSHHCRGEREPMADHDSGQDDATDAADAGKNEAAEAERIRHREELLDEAEMESFPASDPPAISEPRPRKD
jgi:hypothetical protein